MSDNLTLILSCLGLVLLVGLVFAYIITDSLKRKSNCPNCTKKNTAKKSWYFENAKQVNGEENITAGYVSGILQVVAGIGISFVMIFMIKGVLDGIIGGLIQYLAFLIIGIYLTINGVRLLARTARSKGKTMTCFYKCSKCNSEWTEENIITK